MLIHCRVWDDKGPPEYYSSTKSFLKAENLKFLDINAININNNILYDNQIYPFYKENNGIFNLKDVH